jgi:hypothetical protein
MPMIEKQIREPDEIRNDCARKLASAEISGMFSAFLGHLPGDGWTTTHIEDAQVTSDPKGNNLLCRT